MRIHVLKDKCKLFETNKVINAKKHMFLVFDEGLS